MHSRIGPFLSPVHETGQDPHLSVHLDHFIRGPYTLGVGPGAPYDAGMFGMGQSTRRERLGEAFPTVLKLVNGEERIDEETDWYALRGAKPQSPRFSLQGIEVAMTTSGTSSTSPRLAGRYGLSMVSFARFFTPLIFHSGQYNKLARQHGAPLPASGLDPELERKG